MITICYFIFCISVLADTCTSYVIAHDDHCTSVVPESISTARSYNNSVPLLVTNYYTGGDKLLGRRPSEKPHHYVTKFLKLQITRNQAYKFEALLSIRSPYRYYNTTGASKAGSITFSLNGFWSKSSRNLCMVGSASLLTEEDQPINLDAVLKLKFADHNNPAILSSFVSGVLMSTTNYFDPLVIYGFPALPLYDYSLVSQELNIGGFNDDIDVPINNSLNLEASKICSMLSGRFFVFEMEYSPEFNNTITSRNCSPLGNQGYIFLHSFVSLDMIQCSSDQRKVRYVVRFRNITRGVFYEDFDPQWTLIGEGLWDERQQRIIIAACRILNGVDDCTMRLSLRYSSTWTIRDDAKVVGHIWTNTGVNDPRYFRKIKVRSCDENDMVVFQGLRYKYTELNRVQKSCHINKLVEKKRNNRYPEGHSRDMKFDIYVKISQGQRFASGDAMPLSVGNEFYEIFPKHVPEKSMALAPEPDNGISSVPLNISYKIGIRPFRKTKLDNLSPSLYLSMNLRSRVEITAEGVYDARTGHLCMVGCRKLLSYNNKSTNLSTDCEIIVNFEFAPLNARKGGLVKGIIRSTRAKLDPLYFEDLSLLSAALYRNMAKRLIWRIKMEITMVLISSTFTCIFVGLELAHVKRDPSLLPCISLVMVVILSFGHMIQLALNFNSSFLRNRANRRARMLINSGLWLEASELTVMVVTMVSFLMKMRLLGLVWTAKRQTEEKGLWSVEKKAGFVSLVMYICGLYALRDLRLSYAGLILDGFLLPQILFNAFRGSTEKALVDSFYAGISVVRLAPYAYDQYRKQNFAKYYVNGTYSNAKFSSMAFDSIVWDVVIPCGIVVFAVIVYVQQRYGGRCILPMRFRGIGSK